MKGSSTVDWSYQTANVSYMEREKDWMIGQSESRKAPAQLQCFHTSVEHFVLPDQPLGKNTFGS